MPKKSQVIDLVIEYVPWFQDNPEIYFQKKGWCIYERGHEYFSLIFSEFLFTMDYFLEFGSVISEEWA